VTSGVFEAKSGRRAAPCALVIECRIGPAGDSVVHDSDSVIERV